jgi:arylsulfatase
LVTAGLIMLMTIPSSEVTATQRPNLLLIMLDDLGYSDLGCYGSPILEPPTIGLKNSL